MDGTEWIEYWREALIGIGAVLGGIGLSRRALRGARDDEVERKVAERISSLRRQINRENRQRLMAVESSIEDLQDQIDRNHNDNLALRRIAHAGFLELKQKVEAVIRTLEDPPKPN